MKPRAWLLPVIGLFLIGAGVAFCLRGSPYLVIVNTDRGREFRIPLGSRFTLSYVNSIYRAPAAEDFEVGEKNEIVLKGVRTRSAAVAQYYGFEDGREYYPVERRMKSFALRVGMTDLQALDVGNEKVSLGKMGSAGDRLEFRVEKLSQARVWLSRITKD